MTINAIREKLINYLEIADANKLKAIYTLLKAEIDPIGNDWDDDFEKSLNNRRKTFMNGSAKSYSWEETKMAAINKGKPPSV